MNDIYIKDSTEDLYQEAPFGYFSANSDQIIFKINETLLDWLGYSKEEIIDKIKWTELLSVGGKIYFQTHFSPLLFIKDFIEEINFDFIKKDNEKLPVLLNTKVKRNENGKIILFRIVVIRFTQRKSYEREILNYRHQAEIANLAKSEFLATMSHEIRTSLNGIIGFTDLLVNTKLNSIQDEYMKIVNRSANSLLALLNDILDFSKIEAGKLELLEESVDIIELCNQATDLIKIKANEKNIQINSNFSQDIPHHIYTDSIRLRQIIINLLSNAIKFTSDGEIELKIELSSTEKSTEEVSLLFSVRDTGIGISLEKQKSVFEAFVQEETNTSRKYGGTGLGLAITNKLLGLMNSKLELKSEPGVGSIFFFHLKVKADQKSNNSKIELLNSIENSKEVNFDNPLYLKKFKLLVADDDEVNMYLNSIILKQILPNAILTEAVNGLEAIEKFKEETPDLIFMDIQMPEMNGYDATLEIRKQQYAKEIPIIALTAETMKEEIEKCFEVGMDDYASKPINKIVFGKLINKWLILKS